MFSEKNLIYILTSLEVIEKLFIYTNNFKNAHDFWLKNNQMNFNASSNLLLVIGEETQKIEHDLKNKFSEIRWQAIADLRNRLAHDYRGADSDILWQILTSELVSLKEVLIKMLNEIIINKKILNYALNSEYYKHLDYLKYLT